MLDNKRQQKEFLAIENQYSIGVCIYNQKIIHDFDVVHCEQCTLYNRVGQFFRISNYSVW